MLCQFAVTDAKPLLVGACTQCLTAKAPPANLLGVHVLATVQLLGAKQVALSEPVKPLLHVPVHVVL